MRKKLQDLLAALRLNINTDGPKELTSVTMTEKRKHRKRVNYLKNWFRKEQNAQTGIDGGRNQSRS